MINRKMLTIAIELLVDIGIHLNKTNRYQNLSDVSKRVGYSLSYVEQITAKLKKGGVLNAKRGPAGGYFLGCSPSEITIKLIRDAIGANHDTSERLKPLTDRLKVFENETNLGQLMEEFEINERNEV